MEIELREALEDVCFGYMWENTDGNSYSTTLVCELRSGYMAPKAKAKKLEKITNNVKEILYKSGYDIKSIRGFVNTCKAVSFTYFSIRDGKEYKLDKDVDRYRGFMPMPSRPIWIYEFEVKIEITQADETEVIESLKEDTSNSEKINDFIEDLYDLRKDSIAKDGEYGLGNLVFKEFRNLGYLDNLKELKNEYKSKELSLESLKE